MSGFKPATRDKLKLRLALDGPSGSGKSVTSQRLAMALAAGGKVAVIDTESGSASKYVGEDFGEGPIAFDVRELSSFSPDQYTVAIEEADKLGYTVLVIDSLSHAWEGKDGALELKDRAAAKGGNSFTAWKDITPMHRRMVEAILHSRCHVICTMRSKTEYVLEKNERGRDVPRKVGTAPVQRAGMEYEFDIYGSMDLSHILTVTKSRCRAVDGAVVLHPGGDFAAPIRAWLETGAAVEPQPAPQQYTPAKSDKPQQKAAPAEKALPRDGVELVERLEKFEAAMVKAGECKPLELMAHVQVEGVKAGWPNTISAYTEKAIAWAAECAKAFAAARKGDAPLLAPKELASLCAEFRAQIDDLTEDTKGYDEMELDLGRRQKDLGRARWEELVGAVREKARAAEAARAAAKPKRAKAG